MLNYVRKLNNDMDFVVYFPILVISIVTVFFGLFHSLISSDNNYSFLSEVFPAFLGYFAVIQFYESTKENNKNLEPFLNISNGKIRKNCLKINLKNVGKGNLYNLELDENSKEELINIGYINFNKFDFDINMFCDYCIEYEIQLKKDIDYRCRIPKFISLYYDDSLDNHYKQVINIGLDGDNVVFMPTKPEICKKRNRGV